MIFSEKTKTQPISKEQVWAAWLRVRSHHTKGSGVDGVSLEMIEQNPRKYLYPVWNRLASGSYMASPVKEMRIPKGNRAWRTLGIPTICDRVAQDVVREELTRIVEPLFHKWSFAFRPNKSAHDAIDACKQQVKKFNFVIDLDIKGYFDNIDHQHMMTVLRRYTDKSYILTYCERWLKASVVHTDGTITDNRTKGTPQGGVISPVLSNLFLHAAFDTWMEREYPNLPYERFADDIVVHTMTLKQSRFMLDKIRERLGQFKLELHPVKTNNEAHLLRHHQGGRAVECEDPGMDTVLQESSALEPAVIVSRCELSANQMADAQTSGKVSSRKTKVLVLGALLPNAVLPLAIGTDRMSLLRRAV